LYNILVQPKERVMPETVTYSYARQNLAQILREAEERQEPVIIKRRGHEDMALIPAEELRSLEETAHLLRSPRNAQRLLKALQRALETGGSPETPEALRLELGLR
jgi:antitoxin YefM